VLQVTVPVGLKPETMTVQLMGRDEMGFCERVMVNEEETWLRTEAPFSTLFPFAFIGWIPNAKINHTRNGRSILEEA
jgi:hypothetical protein